jgi:hypothetical protein
MSIEKSTPPQHENLQEIHDFKLIVARHAAYFDTESEREFYANIQELSGEKRTSAENDAKALLGHLKKEGVEQAKKLGIDILSEALVDGRPTDITFIASKQEYESPQFPEAPWAGRRAEETANEALLAISTELHKLESAGQLLPDQIRLVTPIPEQTFATGSKPNDMLVERDVYYSPLSQGRSLVDAYKDHTSQLIEIEKSTGESQTTGYFTPSQVEVSESSAFSNREKELWSRGQVDLDKFGYEINNETSQVVAERVMDVIGDFNDLARLHQEHFPDRHLIVVLVTHDAVMGALSYQGFGTSRPMIPSFTDRMDIQISDGVATLTCEGNQYSKVINNE